MDNTITESENSKISEPHRLLLNLADEIKLQRSEKYVALSNLSMYYTWKNIKNSYKNNKFKISAPIWNEKVDVSDRSYSVSDIQDFFEYIFKKDREKTENPSIAIFIKIKQIIEQQLKLKRHYFELLTSETIKLLGSTEKNIIKAAMVKTFFI